MFPASYEDTTTMAVKKSTFYLLIQQLEPMVMFKF